MTSCSIRASVTGQPAMDGAGVQLVRVLGHDTARAFDPFLMLDSFDSTDPAAYMAGFPLHPHRGIETITYLASGRIDHRDSLGNAGTIGDGQAQWMCAGSGILHEEMPQPSERLLGVQIWLNLPSGEKMCRPAYHLISDVAEVEPAAGVLVRVVAGEFGGVAGFAGDHLPAEFYELQLSPGAALDVPVAAGHAAYAFLLEGDVVVSGVHEPAKTALAFASDGDSASFASTGEHPVRILYFSAPRLDESIAWGGPVVMNTEEELNRAFLEMGNGTFVKEQPEG